MDLGYWFWVVFAYVVACIPVLLMKYYVESKNILFIVSSLIAYCVLMYAYTIVLPSQDMTIMNVILVGLSIMLLTLGGIIHINN
jgi:multidrug transporter EmrE-like cation transporter